MIPMLKSPKVKNKPLLGVPLTLHLTLASTSSMFSSFVAQLFYLGSLVSGVVLLDADPLV